MLATSTKLFLLLCFLMSYLLHSFWLWGSNCFFSIRNVLHTPWRTVCFMAFCQELRLCWSNLSHILLLIFPLHRPLCWSNISRSLLLRLLQNRVSPLSSSICISSSGEHSLFICLATTPRYSPLFALLSAAILSLSHLYKTVDCIDVAHAMLLLRAPLFDTSILKER